MAGESQFRLLGERRFLPFFGTQALGAFNDNVYKNALLLVATYDTAAYSALDPVLLTQLGNGLFILPFVLFSGLAGQLADRYDKAVVMRVVKLCEVAIMVLAGIGFARHDIWLLLAALFLMGSHSTFFAPAKYGCLPQVLVEDELVGGNALLEMGTFVAILLGQVLAGVLAAAHELSVLVGGLFAIALAGLVTSLFIPSIPPAAPGLRIDRNIARSTVANLAAAYADRTVFLAVLGISWFWFYGALVVAQLPLYAKAVLHGSEEVVHDAAARFSLGVGTGSMLCERLSGRRLEIGLVPLGSLGLTAVRHRRVFRDARGGATGAARPDGAPRHGLRPPRRGRLRAHRPLRRPLHRAALCVDAAPDAGGVRLAGRERQQHLERAVHGGRGALWHAAPQARRDDPRGAARRRGAQLRRDRVHLRRACPSSCSASSPGWWRGCCTGSASPASRTCPREGPALVVCNHVSFVDALVLSAAVHRPMRFVMEASIFRIAGRQPRVPRHEGDPDRLGARGPGGARGGLRAGARGTRGRTSWSASSRKAA